MTAEELDALLAKLPVNPNPPAVPPERHQDRPITLSPSGQATLDMLRRRPLQGPAITIGPTEAQRAEARAARLAERRAKIANRRAEFWPRIRNAKLAIRLRKTDTPCGLLIGPSGIGKTSAAHWIAARYYPGLWVTARELGGAERGYPLGAGIPPLLREAIAGKFLYLDDIGTEDTRDLGVIQHVIDQRYAACLPTFATSGLTASALASYLGAPYVRRLVEQHAKRPNGEAIPVLFLDCHQATR